MTRRSTHRKLIELITLTTMARKNFGLNFCLRRLTGCHFTGRNNLDFTGTSEPERLRLLVGV
jgi:hypothetical protein